MIKPITLAILIAITPQPAAAKVYLGGLLSELEYSNCKYNRGDLLLSRSALEAVYCTPEQLRGVTRCFHLPYDRRTRKPVLWAFPIVRKIMLQSIDDLSGVLDQMDRTNWKTFVCKRNARVWFEPRWQRLK